MSDALDKLFDLPDALESGHEADAAFLAAMQVALAHHYARSQVYRSVCEMAGFTPASLRNSGDLQKLPWLLVDVFKAYDLTSVPQQQIVTTFTSSGTSGQKSHVSWDKGSFERQGLMRRKIMEAYGLVDTAPANYICFSYDHQTAEHRGAAYAHSAYMGFAPAHEVFFAIHPGPDGEPAFDAGECVAVLNRFARQPYPLRITGFPSFAWRVLAAVKHGGRSLLFDPRSLIIHGGGWKSLAGEAVSAETYAAAAEEWLGIPRTRVRDVYGFVEHGVPYITCERGRFHVPVYARAFARRPGSLEVLGKNEEGLLQVLSPYNWAQPALSLLSTDYAAVGDACPCGRRGATIDIRGRAGLRKHEGCALTASELLSRTKPETRPAAAPKA